MKKLPERVGSDGAKRDKRTDATAVTHATKMALIINVCPADLAGHLRVSSHMYHMYRKFEGTRSAMRECVDRDSNKGKHAHDDPMDIGAGHGNQQYEDDEGGDLNTLD